MILGRPPYAWSKEYVSVRCKYAPATAAMRKLMRMINRETAPSALEERIGAVGKTAQIKSTAVGITIKDATICAYSNELGFTKRIKIGTAKPAKTRVDVKKE
jgi:hypothetical protein